MKPRRTLVLVGMASCLALVTVASGTGVKPIGAYPFALPGVLASPGSNPRALLWCQEGSLLGVVVLDEKSSDCVAAAQKRAAPKALLLRDGRCEAEGASVSFGFLVSRKAWVFEASGRVSEQRDVWLLHRFEGSAKAGQLKGMLVQVDISHPGYPFQRKSVEADALLDEQASFADETAWRGGIAQTFCVAREEPGAK
jgi:hypothetical protein